MEAKILILIDGFMRDAKLYILLGLILANALFAVWAALKTGTFDWLRVADFYKKQVLPMLGGYLTLYILLGLVPGVDTYVANGAQWVAFAPLIAALLAKLASNFQTVFGVVLPGSENPS